MATRTNSNTTTGSSLPTGYIILFRFTLLLMPLSFAFFSAFPPPLEPLPEPHPRCRGSLGRHLRLLVFTETSPPYCYIPSVRPRRLRVERLIVVTIFRCVSSSYIPVSFLFSLGPPTVGSLYVIVEAIRSVHNVQSYVESTLSFLGWPGAWVSQQ